MRQKHPPESKGKRYAIELSCVAWMDLLGYGAMLQEAKFNPNDKRAVLAIRRLKDFQQTVMQQAHAVFPAMPINDGVAYFTDLTRRSTSKTADFLRRSVEAYLAVNEVEKAAGYPGARMVLAVGPRARIGRPRRAPGHLENILARLREGLITEVQATNEAFKAGPIAGFVPQLQANFAFTRAYLANESGSAAGLGGPQCYIDLSLFQDPPPSWIEFSRFQKWSERGLGVVFGEFQSADWTKAGKEHFAGINDHSAIAVGLHM